MKHRCMKYLRAERNPLLIVNYSTSFYPMSNVLIIGTFSCKYPFLQKSRGKDGKLKIFYYRAT